MKDFVEDIRILFRHAEFQKLSKFITRHIQRQRTNKLVFILRRIKACYDFRPKSFPMDLKPIYLTDNFGAAVPITTPKNTSFQDMPPSTVLQHGSVYRTPEGQYRLRNPIGYLIPTSTTFVEAGDGTLKPCGVVQSQQTLPEGPRLERLGRLMEDGHLTYET